MTPFGQRMGRALSPAGYFTALVGEERVPCT
jgi:hypothetical protein